METSGFQSGKMNEEQQKKNIQEPKDESLKHLFQFLSKTVRKIRVRNTNHQTLIPEIKARS